jgi:arylsulfatase B
VLTPLVLSLALQAQPQEAPARANVLVIVLDDVGTDLVGCYGGIPGHTPTLDALAARGVRFTRAYANPWCSPTRAMLLTGRYSFRTGVGFPINRGNEGQPLADEEITLPELLGKASAGALDSSAIGKWHLGSVEDFDAPRRQGFAWYEGWPANFEKSESYVAPQEVRNGELVKLERYITSEEADDALARAKAMREPWFEYFAPHAVHEPLHWPPVELAGPAPAGREPTKPEQVRAMLRTLDREIGRVLEGLGPELRARTNVIVLGDNGTLGVAQEDPRLRDRSKGTLYESGIRVPLIVAGPAVRGGARSCDELVGAIDVFATVAELLGFDARAALPEGHALDSVSFAPLLGDMQAVSARTSLLCEEFRPNGAGPYEEIHRALVSRAGKLSCDPGRPFMYFDLTQRSERIQKLEQLDATQRAEAERLAAELARLIPATPAPASK